MCSRIIGITIYYIIYVYVCKLRITSYTLLVSSYLFIFLCGYIQNFLSIIPISSAFLIFLSKIHFEVSISFGCCISLTLVALFVFCLRLHSNLFVVLLSLDILTCLLLLLQFSQFRLNFCYCTYEFRICWSLIKLYCNKSLLNLRNYFFC